MSNDLKQKSWIVYRYVLPKEISCHIRDKYYIGITSIGMKIRAGNNGCLYAQCPYFYNAIKKYGWDNFIPEILFQNLTRKEANQLEIKLINEYNTCDPEYGFNISPGGFEVSEHVKRKIVQYSITGEYIRIWESITEIKKQLGNIHMENGEQHTSHNSYWRYLDEIDGDYRQPIIILPKTDPRIRRIRQYDIHGNFIKDTTLCGAKKEYGIGVGSAVCGKIKSAYGYQWRYLNQDTPMKLDDLQPETIYRYTLEGEYIDCFSSIGEATKAAGGKGEFARTAFCHVCNNMRLGYRWTNKYYESLPPLIILTCQSKPIIQCKGKSNEIINVYTGTTEVVKYLGSNRRSDIIKCCGHKKLYKTINGDTWHYLQDVNLLEYIIYDEDVKWKIKMIIEIQKTLCKEK